MIEILIPTIAGAIGYFIIGWIFFELLLGKFMTANMTKVAGFSKSNEESSLVWVFVSCLAYSLLLSILFTQWTNTTSIVEGATIGAVVGGLISIMTSTYWWANSHLFSNYKPILADVFAAIITVGFMGGVIAAVITVL